MRFVTVNEVDLQDLMAMANGDMEDTISDLDFLETLAAYRCILVPPFVFRTCPTGELARVCPIQYDEDGELDKASILVAAARHLHGTTPIPRRASTFGGRFAAD